MEGAITLLVLLLIAILIIPLILAITSNSKLNTLINSIDSIKKQLKKLEEENKNNSGTKQQNSKKEIIKDITLEIINVVKEEVITTPSIPETRIELIEPDTKEEINEATVLQPIKPIKTPSKIKERNWEKFIGEKLISIIGIAILVLGIFFIVKWANNRNLLSDGLKIVLGLISGTTLIGVAHKLSKKYRAFSSILAGGGISVLYFSIYEAYQAYHLIPQIGAFIAMILITIFAVILSIIYDKKELGVIAIIGGFCTPFFVNNGSGNYQVLFSYLIILNIGMFALAYFKKWNLINILSFAFTLIIFGSWVYKDFNIGHTHPQNGLLFATCFYLIFFGMNIIYNLRKKINYQPIDITLLLSNTAAYFGVGLLFLKSINTGQYQGIFTMCLALFNFIFAYTFYVKNKVDKNLIYLLIGLVLTFVSLIAPIQLEGNYITLFWACEMVLLFWLGQKSNLEIIKASSILVMVLAIISLLIDWNSNYYGIQINRYSIVFNRAFITGLIVILSLLLKTKLIHSDIEDKRYLWGLITKTIYKTALGVITISLIYAVGFLEVTYQIEHIFRNTLFSSMAFWIYQYLFMASIVSYGCNKKWNIKTLTIILAISGISLLLFPVANATISNFRDLILTKNMMHPHFIFHILIPTLAIIIILLMIKFLKYNFTINEVISKLSTWLLTFMFLLITSSELVHIWVYTNFEVGFSIAQSATKAIKIAWPILWSLISLSLMIFGMRNKIKLFRIIALVLFAITIIKLFIYDISNVSQGGKIAAFIILGIVLLLVSFLYQKIKGIFIEEEENESLNK